MTRSITRRSISQGFRPDFYALDRFLPWFYTKWNLHNPGQNRLFGEPCYAEITMEPFWLPKVRTTHLHQDIVGTLTQTRNADAGTQTNVPVAWHSDEGECYASDDVTLNYEIRYG